MCLAEKAQNKRELNNVRDKNPKQLLPTFTTTTTILLYLVFHRFQEREGKHTRHTLSYKATSSPVDYEIRIFVVPVNGGYKQI